MTVSVTSNKTIGIGNKDSLFHASAIVNDEDLTYPEGRIILAFDHPGGGYSEHVSPADARKIALAIDAVVTGLEGGQKKVPGLSMKRLCGYSELFNYADALKSAGYPPDKICEEIRRVSQEVVAQFAGGS